MNRIRLPRHFLATLLVLVPLPTRAQWQGAHAPAPGPTRDAASVGLTMAPRSTPATAAEGAPLHRAANVAVSAAAGALAGWIFFTTTVGALASDHGAPYKRERRRWMIDGAVLGALIGAFEPPDHRRPDIVAW